MKHLLLNFPLPPSVNKQFFVVRGKMIKSTLARQFDKAVQDYKLRNHKNLEDISKDLKSKLDKGYYLRADFYFGFHQEKLIGKKDQIKALDRTNRLKSTEDAVSKCLDIDDKYIITGTVEKAIVPQELEECSIVIIQPIVEIKTMEQILRLESL